jgi:hypothetical protein
MKITFVKDEDGITVNMFSEDVDYCIDYDIPYVPEKLVDHRPMAIRILCLQRNINWRDLELDDDLIRGLEYLENPIYVKRAIQRKEKTKSFSF